MVNRWLIGLILQCLSLVAHGRAFAYEAIYEQSGASIECSFELKISQVTFDLGKYTNLKKAYTGFQSQLGSSYTTFENALRKCNNDVLTAFDNNTALFNKLGNIKDLGETELAERMAKVSKGEDFGVLKVGNNSVGVNGVGNVAQSLTGALKNTYDDIIRFGGSAVENNGVLKLLSKNGDEVAQISNGKILPTKYFDDIAHSGATPIGQPANGYQVFKKGDDLMVKRMPDKSAYSTSELTELTQHPDAHVLERHGHDVTDEALIKRANDGIAPDGSTTASGNPPPYSSKFESPQKVVDALNNTKPGTTAFNSGVTQGSIKKVTYTTSSGTFGKGVPRNGNTFQSTNKVLAIYKDTGGGNYQLLTMYPDF